MTKLSLPMAGYSPTIADFDNDGWKDIFVSRGHVQSLLSAPNLSDRAAQHCVSESGWDEILCFDGGGRTDRATAVAASGIGGRRS